MGEQLSLLQAPDHGYLGLHRLEVVVSERTIDPDDPRVIGFMRTHRGEAPPDARLVWVMGRRGQARMYVLAAGILRNTYPDYAGAWTDLDNAVAEHLGATILDVFWTMSGPVERWREET